MRYFISPELHRNLWLKFSPLKIAAVPVLLLLMILIAINTDDRDPYKNLMQFALSAYYLIVILWGNYEAANALQDEVKGKTWDSQRMSSMNPAQLAFGKLFGATSYIWYAGIPLLCIFAYACSNHITSYPAIYDGIRYIPQQFTTPLLAPWITFFITIMLFLSAFIGHAVAFLASFSDITAVRNKLGRLYVPQSIIAFIVGFIVSSLTFSQARITTGGWIEWGRFTEQKNTQWFMLHLDRDFFIVASLVFFIGWALIGIYRTARAELMYQTSPFGWGFFVLTTCIYFAGFIDIHSKGYYQHNYALQTFSFLFCMSFLLTYFAMISEAADFAKYRRFWRAWKLKNKTDILQNMPRWIATTFLVAAFYVMMLQQHLIAEKTNLDFIAFFALTTGFLLFAIRDGLVIHAIHMDSTIRNTRLYLILYFLLAYVLLPTLHFSLLDINARYADRIMRIIKEGMDSSRWKPEFWGSKFGVIALYYPSAINSIYLNLLPVIIQILVACKWLQYRIKKAQPV